MRPAREGGEPGRVAEFDGRTVLITGGGSGMGLATARRLVEEGASVVLAGRRAETVQDAARELDPSGDRTLAVATDVSKMDDLDALVGRVRERFGRLDGVFVNAGVAQPEMALPVPREFSEAEFEHVVGTNYKGAVFTIQKAVPLLREGGSIVVNSSVLASHGVGLPVGLASVYITTKAAVAKLALAFAADLAGRGIRVNAVSPGFIETDMLDVLLPVEEAREATRAMVPMGRLGRSEDVADAVVFLLSARASYITGQNLGVDGGVAETLPMPPVAAA
jgi:NAD(P)-dependent dehydrogenase (short-subunit alcohol dehydrogenase family)